MSSLHVLVPRNGYSSWLVMKMSFLWRNDGEGLKACYSDCCLIAFITLPKGGLC